VLRFVPPSDRKLRLWRHLTRVAPGINGK
jgi:hypothetical protein